MKTYVIIILFAVFSMLIIPVFAQSTPDSITVTTDKSSYTGDEVIIVSGNIYEIMSEQYTVGIGISNEFFHRYSSQVKMNENGDFIINVYETRDYWEDTKHTVNISYAGQTAETTFDYIKGDDYDYHRGNVTLTFDKNNYEFGDTVIIELEYIPKKTNTDVTISAEVHIMDKNIGLDERMYVDTDGSNFATFSFPLTHPDLVIGETVLVNPSFIISVENLDYNKSFTSEIKYHEITLNSDLASTMIEYKQQTQNLKSTVDEHDVMLDEYDIKLDEYDSDIIKLQNDTIQIQSDMDSMYDTFSNAINSLQLQFSSIILSIFSNTERIISLEEEIEEHLYCGEPQSHYFVIRGTNATDTIIGTDHDDLIFGDDGDDFIDGMDGNDCIFGEGGDDVLHGQDGDDTLNGGSGTDELYGDDGNDTCIDGESLSSCETITNS